MLYWGSQKYAIGNWVKIYDFLLIFLFKDFYSTMNSSNLLYLNYFNNWNFEFRVRFFFAKKIKFNSINPR